MEESVFREIIVRAHEQRGVEFKGPGSKKDKHLFAKVTRAAQSMANRRDGGIVIIGIDENRNGELNLVGLTDQDLLGWERDELGDSFAEFSDPPFSFEVETLGYEGKSFVVITVDEFADIPILCKKSFPDVLRKGACYVRTRRKPETVEIPSQENMRDLLELAIEKGVRRFIQQAFSAGLSLSPETISTDAQLFDNQINNFYGAR